MNRSLMLTWVDCNCCVVAPETALPFIPDEFDEPEDPKRLFPPGCKLVAPPTLRVPNSPDEVLPPPTFA
jgi:hypothetical protein